MKMLTTTDSQTHCRLFSRMLGEALISALALSLGAGCSVQNFDHLTNGGAATTLPPVAGATSAGGTGANTTNIGGTANASQGGSAQGGASSGTQGGTASTLGGATQGGATAATGGAVQTGGNAAGGASSGPCPMFTGTGGSVVTPPSNGFESNTAGWLTTAQRADPITLVSGATDACVGSSYLQCAGSGRTADWDGPAIDLLPYIVPGHKYWVTLVGRFSPQDAPTAASTITFSEALACSESTTPSFINLVTNPAVLTSWTRFSKELVVTQSGCTPTSMRVYLESTAATKTIQLDDFQLIDVTSASAGTGGAPGTGGGPSAGGASATGGAATAAGGVAAATGGAASATCGAPVSTGGAPATGGAPTATGGDSSAGGSSETAPDAG